MALSEDARRFIVEVSPVGHVVTLDTDGSPQVTMAWIGIDGAQLVFGTLFDQRKLRNLRRDPRICISFEGVVTRPPGLREYLVVQGLASVEPGGAPALLHDLARRYLGPEVEFPPMADPPPGFVTRVTVERVSGVGPWTDSD